MSENNINEEMFPCDDSSLAGKKIIEIDEDMVDHKLISKKGNKTKEFVLKAKKQKLDKVVSVNKRIIELIESMNNLGLISYEEHKKDGLVLSGKKRKIDKADDYATPAQKIPKSEGKDQKDEKQNHK